MDQPEQEWISAYRSGDIDALAQLVEHFRRPLFSFILRMVTNAADAEEIFQEVWLRVVRNFDRFQGDKFISWLFRIAHNLVIDRVRKDRRFVDLHRDGEDDDNPAEHLAIDTTPGPDLLASDSELGIRIRAALENLPHDQRAVFLLRTEADMPFKDIARLHGISINTALARMQYALRKLQAALHHDYLSIQRGTS